MHAQTWFDKTTRHFPSRKICSKNRILAKDIARPPYPDVDFGDHMNF